jgi:outer membrane protein assembly factor BamB
VYALGAAGVLRCLNGSDGTLVWSEDLRKKYDVTAQEDEAAVMWGRAGSPLIVDSMVVVPGGGKARKNLVAFDAATGKVAWEAENKKEDGTLDQIGYASPSLATLAGRRQIVIGNESTVSGHDPATGNRLWSFPWPGHSNGDACNSQAAVVDDRRLLLSKGYSGGAELIEINEGKGPDEFTATSVWKVPRVLQTKFTNVVIHAGHAYGLSEEILECVDLDSGKRKWKAGRFGHGQILGVGELLLVLSEEGELNLVELNPNKFISHGSIQALEGKTWNNLCLYGKRLLVRNAQEAACFTLP